MNRAALIIVLGIALAGCALFSKSQPLSPRFFDPGGDVASAPALNSQPAETRQEGQLALRLGDVSSASHIGSKIVYRSATHELGFYDELRWSERPENYLTRELERSLFEQHGLPRAVSGIALTLEVSLVTFEEVRSPPEHARVELLVTLHDDHRALIQQTVFAELPIDPRTGDKASAVVAALSGALQHAVDQVAAGVVAELNRVQVARAAAAAPAQPSVAAQTTVTSP